MELSLCALLPVYNAQASVARLAGEYLDILPDLTSNFQLLIVDDGSTDDTAETAFEFASRYPQVRVIAHPARLGPAVICETGLRESAGEILFFRDCGAGVDSQSLSSMWPSIRECDVVIARQRRPAVLGWIPKSPSGGGSPAARTLDLCFLARRPVIQRWIESRPTGDLETFLASSQYSCRFVEVRQRSAGKGRNRHLAVSGKAKDRADSPSSRRPAVARPNYLSKLRDFALGE